MRERGALKSDVVRVVVIEQDPIYRRGLMAILGDVAEIEVVGHADSIEAASKLVEEVSPSVALVGTPLSGALGPGFAGEIRQRFPTVPTVVMSSRESDDELLAAMRAGASAYVGRGISEETIRQVVIRAASGEYVIDEQLLSKRGVAVRVLDQFRKNHTSDTLVRQSVMPLTDRELEILRKVSEGMTNAEIGYALGISAQTVKNHVTSILKKLAVNDRTQAVVTALRKGWITIEETESSNDVSAIETNQLDAEAPIEGA